MDKINHWVVNRGGINYDSEEVSVLGLVGKVTHKTNEVIEQLNNIETNVTNKVSHDEINQFYKIDKNGDFKGTWCGLSKPTLSVEGATALTEQNAKDISILNTKISERTKQPPIIVGHRGLGGVAPENTMNSFKLAIKNGIKAIEFDIRESKDGYLIVMHDETIDRTTNGAGKVEELTKEYIDTLIIDGGNGVNYFYNQHIPEVEEILKLCQINEVTPVIHICKMLSATNVYKVVDLVEKYKLTNNAIILLSGDITFSYADEIRKISSVKLGIQMQPFNEENYSKAKTYDNIIIGFDTPYELQNAIRVNNEGYDTILFNADDEETLNLALQHGFDLIGTNKLMEV